MFFNKNAWGKSILSVALSFFVMTIYTSCEKNEPSSNNPDDPTVENPSNPDFPDTPDTPDTPDSPDVPSGDDSKYYIPEREEFFGAWRSDWLKVERYSYSGGKWSLSQTTIVEGYGEVYDYSTAWASAIAFLDDGIWADKMVWGSPAYRLSEVLQLIEDKGSAQIGGLTIENGNLLGDVYEWTWYPNAGNDVSMIVLKYNGEVNYRWKITEFDGESFTCSPAFYDDFPTDTNINKYFYSYKYHKYTPELN